jgi:hypothetical protein
MNIQLPIAIRATAAALAVFMTTTTLNGMVSLAEPQQSQLLAHAAPRSNADAAVPLQRVVIVAQAHGASTAQP